MAVSNAHFRKLKDFITLQLPAGFPVKIGECIFVFSWIYTNNGSMSVGFSSQYHNSSIMIQWSVVLGIAPSFHGEIIIQMIMVKSIILYLCW